MPMETTQPQSFAGLITSPAYPVWAKPEPADNPTRHRKTYTFLRAMMANWDRLVDGAQSAAYCHGSQTAPADALDDLGDTYGGLARALRDDSVSYRAYLKNPLSRWYRFGTKVGLVGELAHLGYPGAQVVSWRNLVDAGAGAANVVFGGNVNFFYIAIFAPNPIATLYARWLASGGTWGSGSSWGGAPTAFAYLDEIRRVLAMVKPAHTSCRHIVCFADTLSGLNAQLLPTGSYSVFPVNEPWERIRPSYAYNRYYTTSPLVP